MRPDSLPCKSSDTLLSRFDGGKLGVAQQNVSIGQTLAVLKGAVSATPSNAVAFACSVLQLRPVHDIDMPPRVSEDTVVLKDMREKRHSAAPHADHVRQYLLGEWQPFPG